MSMFSRMLRRAGATAIAVAFCLTAAGPVLAADYPDFNDESVTKRTEQIIEERSKDGVFVYHDPKLNEDLNLVYEKMRVIRGMKGYGWFANAIFHDKDEPKKRKSTTQGEQPHCPPHRAWYIRPNARKRGSLRCRSAPAAAFCICRVRTPGHWKKPRHCPPMH